MNAIKQRLFTDWHLVRMMRLGIGIMMLVAGIHSKDWTMGLFSSFFLYQALTNTGCCGTQSCYTPKVVKKTDPIVSSGEEAIDFEEVKL